MGWPQDSWICSATCAPSRMTVVVPGCHASGAEQRRRFFGDARGVAGEVVALDELPPLGALVAADAVGVGAVLHLALVDRRGLDAAARLV